MFNRVGHFEIHASNPEKLIEFYTEIFDWEIKKWEGGQFEYWTVMTGGRDEVGGINGGLLRRPCPPPKEGEGNNAYVCTIIVEDYDTIAKKILVHGGKLALPKMALVGMAWQGYFLDPDGNTFGLHQPDEKAV